MRILHFKDSKDLVAIIDPKSEFAKNRNFMDWVINPWNGATKTVTDRGWSCIINTLEINPVDYCLIWTWEPELEDLSIDDPTEDEETENREDNN